MKLITCRINTHIKVLTISGHKLIKYVKDCWCVHEVVDPSVESGP